MDAMLSPADAADRDEAATPDGDILVSLVTGGGAGIDRGTAILDAGDGAIVLGGVTDGELEPGKKKGGIDMFLARYEADRSRAWLRQIGSGGDDTLTAVARDAEGALYAVGHTYGALGGTAYGKADIAVAKFDADGAPIWIKQFGSAEEDRAFSAVAIGTTLYVGGSTTGKFLPGTVPQQEDGFIVEIDPDGNIVRSTLIGSEGVDRVTALFPGAADTLYAAGTTTGAIHGNGSFGNTDGFLANYDLSLERRWTRQVGTSEADMMITGVAGPENILLAGMTFGSFDDEINAGNYDALLLAFDLNGDRLFSRQHGNDGPDAFHGIAVAPDGSIVATGSSFGPVFSQPATGGYEIITVRYDRSGRLLDTLQYGSAGDDGAYAAVANGAGATLTGVVDMNYFLMDIKW